MSNRNTKVLLKVSNLTGKTPTTANLEMGEVAVNVADAKMYSLYTGGAGSATEVRQIGWDKLSLTGGSVTGSISATTFFGNGSQLTGIPNTFVTGGTLTSGTATFRNNTGGTFTVTGFTNTFVTGGTANNSAKTYTFTNNTGGTFNVTALTDLTVTGGTYTNTTGIATFRNNTGGTFNVTGFTTGATNSFITGGTYTNATGTAVFRNSTGGTFNVTGFTTGSTDTFVTGGTYSNGVATLINNTGGSFTISGFSTDTNTFVTGGTANNSSRVYTFTNSTGGTFSVDGLNDLTITGGTYNTSSGVATFVNSTGGTFSVTGFNTGTTDTNTFVTGGTHTAGTTTFRNSTGGTFTIAGYSTGTTDTNTFVTGGTANNAAKTYTFTNSTGGTFSVTALTDIQVTGGTHTAGTTTFRNSTGGTFSVTGYSTGSTDTLVTGGTYSDGSATFRNNTGGTFSVSGFSTSSEKSISDWRNTNYLLSKSLGLVHSNENKQTFTLPTGIGQLHNLLYLNGKIYTGTQTYPHKIIRFNNLDDLSDYSINNLSNDYFEYLQDLVYSKTKKKLYTNSGVNAGFVILEVDPDTLVETIIYTLPFDTYGGQGFDSYATDDENLYLLYRHFTTGSCRIIKLNLTTYNVTLNVTIPSVANVHAIRYDGTHLFVTTTESPAKILKINPTDLSIIASATFASGENIATDDFAIVGDYVWVGLETLSGTVLRIKKSDLSITRIQTGVLSACYATFFDGKYVWVLYNSTPATIVRINPETLEVYKHTLDTGENSANEIVTDGQRLFITTYTTPAKIIRLSIPSLTYVSSQVPTGTDTFITGGTYNAGTATFINNTGGTFNVTGFTTGSTAGIDTVVTGGTYSNGTATFTNNTGGTFSVTGFTTGSTDTFLTGGTFTAGTATFINNTGGTFNVTGFTTGVSSLNTIGSTPNASGATITGSTLTLQPADANFGGIVTTGAQTFAGDKTFSGTVRPVAGLVFNGSSDFGKFLKADINGVYSPFTNNTSYYTKVPTLTKDPNTAYSVNITTSENVMQTSGQGKAGSIRLTQLQDTSDLIWNARISIFDLRYGKVSTVLFSVYDLAGSLGGVNATYTGNYRFRAGKDNNKMFIELGNNDINWGPIDNWGDSQIIVDYVAYGQTGLVAAYAATSIMAGITTGTTGTVIKDVVSGIPVSVSTVGAIGSSPNASGATITGNLLNLQPASIDFGGIVTTGTQTFAGNKTFNGDFLSVINPASAVSRIRIGNFSDYAGIWTTNITPSLTNYTILNDNNGGTLINGTSNISFRVNNDFNNSLSYTSAKNLVVGQNEGSPITGLAKLHVKGGGHFEDLLTVTKNVGGSGLPAFGSGLSMNIRNNYTINGNAPLNNHFGSDNALHILGNPIGTPFQAYQSAAQRNALFIRDTEYLDGGNVESLSSSNSYLLVTGSKITIIANQVISSQIESSDITNFIDLQIQSPATGIVGKVTNHYAISQDSPTAINRFAGVMNISSSNANGVKIGNYLNSADNGIWFNQATPNVTNYNFLFDVVLNQAVFNGVNGVAIRVGGDYVNEVAYDSNKRFSIGYNPIGRTITEKFQVNGSAKIEGNLQLTTTGNTVTGNLSLIIGSNHESVGSFNIINGDDNHALTSYTFLQGNNNYGYSQRTFASGLSHRVFGDSAAAFGLGNYTRAEGEFAMGMYNTDYTLANNLTDRIFSIGYGTGTGDRKNALTVLKNGTASFSTLAGSGTRMVVADASGIISTQPIPSGVSGSTDLSNYVTLDSLQTITGEKTFSNNIRVTNPSNNTTWTTAGWKKGLQLDSTNALQLGATDASFGLGASGGNLYTFAAGDDTSGSTIVYLTTILANGNFGIGATNPLEKLDVVGNIKLSGAFNLSNGTGTTSQVVSKKADGTMEWVTISGGSGGGDMFLATDQTVTGIKTFNNNLFIAPQLSGNTAQAENLFSISKVGDDYTSLYFSSKGDPNTNDWTRTQFKVNAEEGISMSAGTNTFKFDDTFTRLINGNNVFAFDNSSTNISSTGGNANSVIDSYPGHVSASASLSSRSASIAASPELGFLNLNYTFNSNSSTINLNDTGIEISSVFGLAINTPTTFNSSLKLNSITADTKANVLYYDTTSKVVSYGLTPSGDTVLAATQTITGAKTFLNGTLLLRNVANTFNGSFTNTNTANRIYTLPDRALTIDNITTGTTTNGTGFIKGNGTNISFDNTTYYAASNPNGYTNNVGTVTSVTSANANLTIATSATTPVITVVSAPKLTTARTISGTGEATFTTNEFDGSAVATAAVTLTNSAVIGKVLSGYTKGAGTLAATDSILQAFQKLDGNSDLKAPLTSPSFSGTVTLPAGQVVNGVTLSTAQGTNTFLRGDGTYSTPSSGGMSWTNVTGTTQTIVGDSGYVANNAALVTLTLPATSAIGNVVKVIGAGDGGWRVSQLVGQTIRFGSVVTTTGTGGYLASTLQYDSVELVCIVPNSVWTVSTSQGNITYI